MVGGRLRALHHPSHLPEDHVLLDGVHLVLELRPGRVHVGDHGSDVAHDGGEDEDPDEEVHGDKQILHVLHRLGGLADGGQRKCGPVEAVARGYFQMANLLRWNRGLLKSIDFF